MKTIPVLNIYYLLCYAWDRLEEGDVTAVGLAEAHDLKNLLARVLDNGIHRLLRRGLDRGFIEHHGELQGIRGRIDFSSSIRRTSLERGRAVCTFDELSYDVPHNRLIKATLRVLIRTKGLDSDTRDSLAASYRRLESVSDVRVSLSDFARVQLDRNRRHYEFLLQVCRLVHDGSLIDERSGTRVFRDFVRDDAQMARLFESFVRNFLKREQGAFRVGSKTLRWHDAVASAPDLDFLPEMRTDVTLKGSDRSIIIDTKYYLELFQRRYGKPKVRSEHLYQMFSYLYNHAQAAEEPVSGILLYPTVGQAVDLRYTLSGFPVSVRTLNLAQEWPGIRDELLELVS